MGTRIRFRTDGFWFEDGDGREKPTPGDIWEIHWYASPAECRGIHGGVESNCWQGCGHEHKGPLAGYAICCPGCGAVHHWTTASNCGSLKPQSATCDHSGKSSCWTWTGSPQEGTLSASPSLHASGSCGWHGWLKDGELTA